MGNSLSEEITKRQEEKTVDDSLLIRRNNFKILSLKKMDMKLKNLYNMINKLKIIDSTKFIELEKFEFEQLERKINELEYDINKIETDLEDFKIGKEKDIDYDKKILDVIHENKLQDKTIKDLLPYFMVYYMSLQYNNNLNTDTINNNSDIINKIDNKVNNNITTEKHVSFVDECD